MICKKGKEEEKKRKKGGRRNFCERKTGKVAQADIRLKIHDTAGHRASSYHCSTSRLIVRSLPSDRGDLPSPFLPLFTLSDDLSLSLKVVCDEVDQRLTVVVPNEADARVHRDNDRGVTAARHNCDLSCTLLNILGQGMHVRRENSAVRQRKLRGQ